MLLQETQTFCEQLAVRESVFAGKRGCSRKKCFSKKIRFFAKVIRFLAYIGNDVINMNILVDALCKSKGDLLCI
jgi:hypothetical protein